MTTKNENGEAAKSRLADTPGSASLATAIDRYIAGGKEMTARFAEACRRTPSLRPEYENACREIGIPTKL